MTAAVVAILDRDEWSANTDVIVVADARRRRLTWVPRDLWSNRLHDRVNRAVHSGGCEELIRVLGEFGFNCDSGLVLRRGAAEAALAPVSVTVPVSKRLDFWYPLAPTLPIEQGRKQVSFVPPAETLTGERVHQWIGARLLVGGGGSDLMRLERQQVLLRALLRQGFVFPTAIRSPELVQMVGDPIDTLRQVTRHWKMVILGPTVPAMVGNSAVLFYLPPARYALYRGTRFYTHLLNQLTGRQS
jgi:hypothetical protein